MPQPKSTRSAGSRKPAARKPAATRSQQPRSRRAARSRPRARRRAARPPRGSRAARKPAARKPAAAKRREPAQSRRPGSNVESMRETLSDRVVITRDRLAEGRRRRGQERQDARADADKFVQDILKSSRKQTQDFLSDIEQLIGRAGKELETAATDARKQATRRGEKALRQVDKARRKAQPSAFPITGYGDLTASQIVDRVSDLTAAQLRKVRDYEAKNSNRKSVLTAVERKLK